MVGAGKDDYMNLSLGESAEVVSECWTFYAVPTAGVILTAFGCFQS